VNALSEKFLVTSFRDKKLLSAEFKSGELTDKPAADETNESNGTRISFTPDSKLFPNYATISALSGNNSGTTPT